VEAEEWIDSIVEVVFCIMGGIGRGWCRTGAAVTVEADRSDVEPIVADVLSVVTTVEGMLVSGSCAGCRRRYLNGNVSGERPVMGKGSKIRKNKEGSRRREERAQGVLPS
jgi:hypothetical protein